MIERTPEFLAAEHRVKVSHFTRKGYDIGGVIHVGANIGYEVPYYFELGAPKVMLFEPLHSAVVELIQKFGNDPRVSIFPVGLSSIADTSNLDVTKGDGQGSSFFREIGGPYEITHRQPSIVVAFDHLCISMKGYETLVVDVQGYELLVLSGMQDSLPYLKFLNVELSRVPLYVGGHSAQQVIDYLAEVGFEQDSPIEDHNDVFFIRKDLL